MTLHAVCITVIALSRLPRELAASPEVSQISDIHTRICQAWPSGAAPIPGSRRDLDKPALCWPCLAV